MNTRILLVDDHDKIREALRSLLDEQPTVEVVGDTGDGRKAPELVRKLSPDIVIMDLNMPALNGIEVTRSITREFPEVQVIAMSEHHETRFVAAMLGAGVSGYVLKECSFDELVQAIRTVSSGGVHLSSGIDRISIESTES